MSKYHIEKIKCPKCGKEKEACLWDSINTVINPEMKEKVRTGEVFEWSCPDCGYQANLNYAMLYHQMEDQVLIYYVPGNQIEAAEMMKDFFRNDENGQVDSDLSFDKGYRKRVVGTMNQFREKLMILDEGLDDRIIELMKLFMMIQLQEKDPNLDVKEFLFEKMKDGTRCFAVSLGDGKWGHMDYIQRIYEYLLEDFKDILHNESGEVVIDFSWALEAWRSKNNKN